MTLSDEFIKYLRPVIKRKLRAKRRELDLSDNKAKEKHNKMAVNFFHFFVDCAGEYGTKD